MQRQHWIKVLWTRWLGCDFVYVIAITSFLTVYWSMSSSHAAMGHH
jgi:hypothetical protein